jgi:hypothetical protein
MQAPRFVNSRWLVPFAVLVFSLLAAGQARAQPESQEDSAEHSNITQDEAGKALTDEQSRRALAILYTTMIWSGEHPPPDHPPPLVGQPPHRSPRWKPPHHGNTGGTPTTTSLSPEPASLATGLMGSGIACVYAWLRKRRKRRAEL